MAFTGVRPTNSCISLTLKIAKLQRRLFSVPPPPSTPRSITGKSSLSTRSAAQNDVVAVTSHAEAPHSNSFTKHHESPFSGLGLEEAMTGYILGKKKATEVAHAVWKNVVRKGDLVVDATCGNGYDTLALLRLIADDKRRGRVFAMDLQRDALESTSSLLDRSISTDEQELVELYAMCHTKMEEVVPSGVTVRLVAFNLGYLPGGDRKIKTESETTILALEAAKKIVARGGLISIVSYVGHSGGREEFEKIEAFAADLPVDSWVCCKLQTLNRQAAPILVLLFKK